MSILMWNKPEKIMSTEDWKSITADSAPAGVYTPNMSEEDMFKWKGKLIKGKSPRVEIRKSFQKTNNKQYPKHSIVTSQCLIVVSLNNINEMKDCNVLMSMNGKSGLSMKEFEELNLVVNEAKEVLKKLQKK